MSSYQHYWNRYLKVPEFLENYVHRGTVQLMSAHVLLNLLNKLGTRDRAFYCFFATSLINSILQEHVYHMMLNYFQIEFFGLNMK